MSSIQPDYAAIENANPASDTTLGLCGKIPLPETPDVSNGIVLGNRAGHIVPSSAQPDGKKVRTAIDLARERATLLETKAFDQRLYAAYYKIADRAFTHDGDQFRSRYGDVYDDVTKLLTTLDAAHEANRDRELDEAGKWWMWITICPKPDKPAKQYSDLEEVLDRMLRYVWVKQFYLCFEQRSERVESFNGVHAHLLIKRSDIPSNCEKAVRRACSKIVGDPNNKHHLLIVHLTDSLYKQKLNYMRGGKGPEKQITLMVDQAFREEYDIADLYTELNYFEDQPEKESPPEEHIEEKGDQEEEEDSESEEEDGEDEEVTITEGN